MERRFLLISAILGFTGVALGAFGAHGLESTLEANGRAGTFDTASQYHLIHALALMMTGILAAHFHSNRYLLWAGYFFIAGTLIFCGSLYILAIGDLGFMGAIAPIGGVCLLAGWACVGWGIMRDVSYR